MFSLFSLLLLSAPALGAPSFAIRSSIFSTTNKAAIFDQVSYVADMTNPTPEHSVLTREFIGAEITFDGISTYGNGTLYFVNDATSTVIFRAAVDSTGSSQQPALQVYAKAVNHLQFLSSGQMGIVSLQSTEAGDAYFYTEYPGLSGRTQPVGLPSLSRAGAITLVESDGLYLVNVLPGQGSAVNSPIVHVIDVATGKEMNTTLKCNFPTAGDTVITKVYPGANKGHPTLNGLATTIAAGKISMHTVVVNAAEGGCVATPLDAAAGNVVGSTYDHANAKLYGVGDIYFEYDFNSAKFTAGGKADNVEDIELIL
jgi:hypothetical protein